MTQVERIDNRELRSIAYAATSDIHGRGVFASRDIESGEYIGTFSGPEVRRDGVFVLWVYGSEGDRDAVGRSGRNLLRYLNHATPCNAYFDGFDLYAECAITQDEEITIDYGGEL